MVKVQDWANDLFDKKKDKYNEDWHQWIQETNYMFEEIYTDEDREIAWKEGYCEAKNLEDILDGFPDIDEYKKIKNLQVTQYEWEDKEKSNLPCNQLYQKLDKWLDQYFENLFKNNKK